MRRCAQQGSLIIARNGVLLVTPPILQLGVLHNQNSLSTLHRGGSAPKNLIKHHVILSGVYYCEGSIRRKSDLHITPIIIEMTMMIPLVRTKKMVRSAYENKRREVRKLIRFGRFCFYCARRDDDNDKNARQ